METVTLSSKGQFVIPKSIRLDAQLSPGSQLEVSWVDGEIRLRPLVKHTVAELSEVAGCLFKPERQKLSDADTQAAIKRKLKALHAP